MSQSYQQFLITKKKIKRNLVTSPLEEIERKQKKKVPLEKTSIPLYSLLNRNNYVNMLPHDNFL